MFSLRWIPASMPAAPSLDAMIRAMVGRPLTVIGLCDQYGDRGGRTHIAIKHLTGSKKRKIVLTVADAESLASELRTRIDDVAHNREAELHSG